MHIRFEDHGFHRGIDVSIAKFSFYLPIEERTEIGRPIGGDGGHWRFCFGGSSIFINVFSFATYSPLD
jgi:hypothetical protein